MANWEGLAKDSIPEMARLRQKIAALESSRGGLAEALRDLIARIDHPDGLYAAADWDIAVDKARAALAAAEGGKG